MSDFFFYSLEMHIIDVLIPIFIVAGFIVLCFQEKNRGWKEKREISI